MKFVPVRVPEDLVLARFPELDLDPVLLHAHSPARSRTHAPGPVRVQRLLPARAHVQDLGVVPQPLQKIAKDLKHVLALARTHRCPRNRLHALLQELL
jgi:hypothetical protein